MSGLYFGASYEEGVRIGCGWYKHPNKIEPFRRNKCYGCFWKDCCPVILFQNPEAAIKQLI
jgi:hypothetical protein